MEKKMDQSQLPQHIGIIMDGNGRWAKKRGLPRSAGHRAGAAAFRKIIAACKARGIPVLTVYAFSTENWKRPPEEVAAIMRLLEEYIDKAFKSEEEGQGLRVKILGDVGRLSPRLQEKIARLEEQTKDRRQLTVNIALNYGGRDELVHAFRKLAQQVQDGELAPQEVTEARISDALYTAGQPDPDLIIRPSGEKRISNFLIWQAAYAELVYQDVLWPDFGEKELDAALAEYARRQRRFGGI